MNTTSPLLDVQIQKTLRSDQREFALNIQLQSDARRVVIHGPSGAGKSATLKLIAGLDRPDSGAIVVGGQPWFHADQNTCLRPQDRHVGYLFQDYALFPHLTVRQNIAFGLTRSWFNPSRSFPHQQVDYWIEALGLGGLEQQLPAMLSGGQRQRTALARTLITQPRLLLLDEPFAALDLALRAQLRQELDRLLRQLNLPLVLITHDPDDIRAFGDQVFHMKDGRLASA